MSDDIWDNLDSTEFKELQHKIRSATKLLKESGYEVEDIDFPHMIRITNYNFISDYSYDFLHNVDIDTLIIEVDKRYEMLAYASTPQ